MVRCASCGLFGCLENQMEKIPNGCPMDQFQKVYEEAILEYKKPDINRIAKNAAIVEATGYCRWTRLEETIEFAWSMDFKRLGLVFCHGLRREAGKVEKILKKAGFEMKSVGCKTGSKPKELIGLRDEEKVRPGRFEPMCNPIVQAKLLNEVKTQLNIMIGLCVGHDALFIKYSIAPVTILAVKDRVLAHNPLGAIYAESYYGQRLANHRKKTPERD